MKKYTQEEFDAFEVDEYGFKICPTGDYSDIKDFGERCSFGDGCSFGNQCSFGVHNRFGERNSFSERSGFGKWCNFERGRIVNGTYFACDRIGSEKRKTYFFKGDNGYFVRAGCFFGTMEEFIERVKEAHAGTKYEREYLAAVELAKIVLEDGDERN